MNIVEKMINRIISKNARKVVIKEIKMHNNTYSKIANVFIAQKMSGLKESEVMLNRNKAKDIVLNWFKKNYPDTYVKFIDNYNHDGIEIPEGAGRLWHLGISITQLDKADYIYFTEDALDSKGGNIEWEIAKSYDIPIITIE